jgi:phosphocarrier protein HPr
MSSVAEASASLPAAVALHARPAGVLVREASRYESEIVVLAGARMANAKSILELLSLGAVGGTLLLVKASGNDALQAVAGVAELIPKLV